MYTPFDVHVSVLTYSLRPQTNRQVERKPTFTEQFVCVSPPPRGGATCGEGMEGKYITSTHKLLVVEHLLTPSLRIKVVFQTLLSETFDSFLMTHGALSVPNCSHSDAYPSFLPIYEPSAIGDVAETEGPKVGLSLLSTDYTSAIESCVEILRRWNRSRMTPRTTLWCKGREQVEGPSIP